MTYKTSRKVQIKVPQTRAGRGKRGTKKNLSLDSAKGMGGNKRPIYGDDGTQNNARTYPGN